MAQMVKCFLEKYEDVSLITTAYIEVSCARSGNAEEMRKWLWLGISLATDLLMETV